MKAWAFFSMLLALLCSADSIVAAGINPAESYPANPAPVRQESSAQIKLRPPIIPSLKPHESNLVSFNFQNIELRALLLSRAVIESPTSLQIARS